MSRRLLAAVSAVVLLSAAGEARAAEPSNFILCDGSPANMSAGELSMRLLAVTATLGVVGGLVGAPETADKAKRAEGEPGVLACDGALAIEKDPSRLAQLTLARSVHLIEAGKFDQALTTAKSVDQIAPDRVQTAAYRRGPAQSSLELQAATLVRQGKAKDAEQAALSMAEAAPYNIITQIRALTYLSLDDAMSPAKAAYFDRLARILPSGLNLAASARMQAGDFKGAARDLDALESLRDGFFPTAEERPLLLTTQRAVAHLLIGDSAGGDALAAEARTDADRQAQGATTGVNQTTLSQVEELLDFYRIGRLAADGKIAEARAAFSARTRWVAPSPTAVAWLTARLRQGAEPSQLTGALAREPDAIRNDAQATRISALIKPEKANANLFTAVRGEVPDGAYKALAGPVWNTDKSRYLAKRTGKEKFDGEIVMIYPGGLPAPEALLLHSALLAKARGKSGFVLAPSLTRLDGAVVRFGNVGDKGMPPEAFVEANAVIAALSKDIPNPADKAH